MAASPAPQRLRGCRQHARCVLPVVSAPGSASALVPVRLRQQRRWAPWRGVARASAAAVTHSSTPGSNYSEYINLAVLALSQPQVVRQGAVAARTLVPRRWRRRRAPAEPAPVPQLEAASEGDSEDGGGGQRDTHRRSAGQLPPGREPLRNHSSYPSSRRHGVTWRWWRRQRQRHGRPVDWQATTTRQVAGCRGYRYTGRWAPGKMARHLALVHAVQATV